MIPSFHALLREMLDASVFLMSVVRGKCLGGGLEVASVAHRVFASDDAELGQPEILLGVFAPVASVVLPLRIGFAAAADLCLSGRVVSSAEAEAMGLVDEIAGDPFEAALAWAKQRLLGHSASSLRQAVRAFQAGAMSEVRSRLDVVERLYLEELVPTADADEGIRSFLEKRRPIWKNE
jgi:cyclohexa-1,5-dienecarbonyl-CoA hydratase